MWKRSQDQNMTCENLLEKLNGIHRAEVLPLVGLLVELADRILEQPDNASLRKVVESNQNTGRILLQSEAGLLALEAMGFEKVGVGQWLRQDADLTKLSRVKDILVKFQKSESNQENPFRLLLEPCAIIDQQHNQITPIRPIVLPPVTFHHTQHFFARIERIFHQCLRYEYPELLARARQLVPVIELELAAQSRFRVLQKQTKLNNVELPVSIQEMLILELLHWFKEDFFTWVDSPLCENCHGESTFSHMATDSDLNPYTKKVEMHRCSQCNHLSPFPRYEDLNILLETRKGRCGEWANVFTLFCYCMGWDARIVFDETDHVWTEVYSIGQKRWLHCDACENICDQPQIYESGWNKKVSYVLAYSVDEVQDVTWRYSCKHKEVLTRRKYCSEDALIEVLMDLSRRRQKSRSSDRRRYLTKRLVLELADMLTERKPGHSQGQGRQSGSIAWRLARGEVEQTFSWYIDPLVFKNNVAILKYCAADDEYRLFNGPTLERTLNVWAKGCYHIEHVFRKEESDWKMVYLARTENAPNGRISWLFTFPPKSPKQLDTVTVLLNGALYENGNIQVLMSSDDLTENIPIGVKGHLTERFRGKNELKLEATLSGGKGDVAWQHAQLFRQALNSCETIHILQKIMGLGGHQETDVYISTLPEEEKKRALDELREDDNVREQSLQQMREWINKHPNIKKCRTDAPFLLRFLRTKKFSVPQACEMLERYLTIRQLYPQWFRNLDSEDKDLAEIIEAGYLVPLLEREDGRLVLFSCAGKFDPHKYTSAHMVRVHSLVTEALMDEEVNQINGYTYINDESGFQMAHISLWSLTDVRNILRCIQNTTPMRHKANHFLNISSSAIRLIEFAVSLLNEKLKNRIFMYKSVDELYQKVNKKILPKEYGGSVPMSELVQKFKVLLKDRREAILALDDMYIEIDERTCPLISEMNEELGIGLDGSFKRLTVD